MFLVLCITFKITKFAKKRSMKTLLKYLFPNDWYDVEVIDIYHHSSLTGTKELLGKRVIIQKSISTGRYRKVIITIYP